MKVKTLSLINYRNYEDLKIDFINNINIFIGQNAQGKTNIVEAIYYAAMGKSHRSNNDQELIKWQKNNAMIKLDFTRLEIENNLNFQFKLAQNKEIIYNSHNIKPKDLIGLLNVVLFSPEDLSLIKERLLVAGASLILKYHKQILLIISNCCNIIELFYNEIIY